MAKPKKNALGKGLDALFVDNHVEEREVSKLKISEIEPNQNQPRGHFDEEALRELADSILQHGVLQPLVVRPLENGMYQIVAGERRWRASRMAGMVEVPVIIKELTDSETLEIGIIENLQREDLNPIELALGYQTLMDEYKMTQEQVAAKVGKSRPVVANTVRLLNLPPSILEQLQRGELTIGHARALLGLDDPELMIKIAERIPKEDLLVRDIEKIAKKQKEKEEKNTSENKKKPSSWGNSYYKEIELALSAELGRKVSITGKEGKAVLSLEFYNAEELNDLAERLTQKK